MPSPRKPREVPNKERKRTLGHSFEDASSGGSNYVDAAERREFFVSRVFGLPGEPTSPIEGAQFVGMETAHFDPTSAGFENEHGVIRKRADAGTPVSSLFPSCGFSPFSSNGSVKSRGRDPGRSPSEIFLSVT